MLTKVIEQSKIDHFTKWFERADKIVIVSHVSPDGDAIGSSLGLYHFLTSQDKTVNVIVPNAFPDFLKWMPGSKDVLLYDRYKEFADKLIAECPFYTAYSIPAGTYKGQDADVTTVTVKATLIVSASAKDEDVYNLTKAIFENVDAIAAENGKGKELSVENATSGMSAPFHAGAAKYYAEKGVTVETK